VAVGDEEDSSSRSYSQFHFESFNDALSFIFDLIFQQYFQIFALLNQGESDANPIKRCVHVEREADFCLKTHKRTVQWS